MSRNAPLVALLSLLVPGLGQIVSGRPERGGAILIATIIVGNLNAIWLSLYALPPRGLYSFRLPRGLHDLMALYGIVFWIWQVTDAYRLARRAATAGTAK